MSHHLQEFVRDFFPTNSVESLPHPQPAHTGVTLRRQPIIIEAQPANNRVSYRRQPVAIDAPVSRRRLKFIDVNDRDREVAKQKSTAFRENPRLFQQETMLYVKAIVNGYKIPIFVDTGAQASVMSMKTCRSLGLMNIVDVSQAGVATGVGSTRIYGKLWRVPVQIGRTKFHMQFSVLDIGESVILGLDQMKRLGMSVNLKRGGLQIDTCFIPFTQPPQENDQKLAHCEINTCAVM